MQRIARMKSLTTPPVSGGIKPKNLEAASTEPRDRVALRAAGSLSDEDGNGAAPRSVGPSPLSRVPLATPGSEATSNE